MMELAEENGVTLEFATVEEARAAYSFTNLQTFLDIYYKVSAVSGCFGGDACLLLAGGARSENPSENIVDRIASGDQAHAPTHFRSTSTRPRCTPWPTSPPFHRLPRCFRRRTTFTVWPTPTSSAPPPTAWFTSRWYDGPMRPGAEWVGVVSPERHRRSDR